MSGLSPLASNIIGKSSIGHQCACAWYFQSVQKYILINHEAHHLLQSKIKLYIISIILLIYNCFWQTSLWSLLNSTSTILLFYLCGEIILIKHIIGFLLSSPGLEYTVVVLQYQDEPSIITFGIQASYCWMAFHAERKHDKNYYVALEQLIIISLLYVCMWFTLNIVILSVLSSSGCMHPNETF